MKKRTKQATPELTIKEAINEIYQGWIFPLTDELDEAREELRTTPPEAGYDKNRVSLRKIIEGLGDEIKVKRDMINTLREVKRISDFNRDHEVKQLEARLAELKG